MFDEKGNQIYIPNENETRKIMDTASVEFVLPYFYNEKSIDIYDKKNELKLSIDLSQFMKKNLPQEPTEYAEIKSKLKNAILYLLASAGIVILAVIYFILNKIIRKR